MDLPTLRMILMRGLPGSGKSHLARSLLAQADVPGIILSADDFFMQSGAYVFDGTLVAKAHAWNLARVESALASRVPLVIVDNTHTKTADCAPCLRLAAAHSYAVSFVEPATPWAKDPAECARRNTHGVPLAMIERMARRLQAIR